MTLGQAQEGKEAYKGLRLFSKFLLSEINRYKEIQESGEKAIERRGLVSPQSLMKKWTFEIMSECHSHRLTPPWELCLAVYHFLGCTHENEPKGKLKERDAFLKLIETNELSIRKASKEVGVDKRTGARWLKEGSNYWRDTPSFPEWPEYYEKISKLTQFEKFFPLKYRRKK
tara:strand:+ start:529 stop:1044 length:516 start_codon:yes stop_codon:yes gene_type:complete